MKPKPSLCLGFMKGADQIIPGGSKWSKDYSIKHLLVHNLWQWIKLTGSISDNTRCTFFRSPWFDSVSSLGNSWFGCLVFVHTSSSIQIPEMCPNLITFIHNTVFSLYFLSDSLFYFFFYFLVFGVSSCLAFPVIHTGPKHQFSVNFFQRFE